jgi:hypothetical protein
MCDAIASFLRLFHGTIISTALFALLPTAAPKAPFINFALLHHNSCCSGEEYLAFNHGRPGKLLFSLSYLPPFLPPVRAFLPCSRFEGGAFFHVSVPTFTPFHVPTTSWKKIISIPLHSTSSLCQPHFQFQIRFHTIAEQRS